VIGEKFLEKLGYSNMVCVWAYSSESTQYLNYAYEQDGVICYPDEIKVKVCRERGVVSGLDADGYYMSHKERDFEQPKYNLEQAYEKIVGKMDIRSSDLTLIPTGGGNEKLAYEFIGDYNGSTYYVYLDANTLKQTDIFKVVETKQGRLLI
jgi:germination protein YpeB